MLEAVQMFEAILSFLHNPIGMLFAGLVGLIVLSSVRDEIEQRRKSRLKDGQKKTKS